MRNWLAKFALLAVVLSAPSLMSAQNLYAALHGTVTDPTGAVVPGALITVVNSSTSITTTAKTDSKGYYVVPQLQAGGPYAVTITANGFDKATTGNLTLNVNDNRDVDVKLVVGGSNLTVEVNATGLQVETADTQLKQIVTATQLEEIPLLGRDAAGLQKLNPGVVESSDRFGSFSTNGSQTPANSYSLNGVDINDGPLQSEGIQVNPDALQEENIITSTMNPEFARNSGAIVNQIVKSGTNHLHGNAFEYYRDTFLNATPYLSTLKPQFHQNLYGGTLGGPVIHDKLFLFLAYQGLRSRTGAPTSSTTLTAADLAGNFTNDSNFASGGTNSGGLTSNPIPNNIVGALGCPQGSTWSSCFPAVNGTTAVNVPTSAWNSLASSITQKYIPQANSAGDIYNFNSSDTAAQDQGVIRVDYTPTSRDTIWGSSVFQSSPSTASQSFGGGSLPGFGTVQAEHFKIFSGAYTHTFNASTLNELRASYYRFNFKAVEPANPALPSSYGFTGITPQNTTSPGFPYLSIGSFQVGNSLEGPQPRLDSNLTFSDNFTKIVGGHSLKFGGSYEQFRVDNPFAFDNNGNFGYSGGTGGGGLYTSGDPILDFELGIPDTYAQTSNGDINVLASEIYAYAQDSYKATSTLTLNYGIAWDVEAPTKNAQFGGLGINCWSLSSTESVVFPGAPPGLGFPGDPGCNRAGGPTTHFNRFGPRFGFAWSPDSGLPWLTGAPGSHSFSIRGGYGIYYNRDQEEQSLQNLEDPPFFLFSHGAADVGGSPAFTSPFSDVTGTAAVSEPNVFPFTVPTAGATINWAGLYHSLGLATFNPSQYTVPYVENFNLNVQRSLSSTLLLQVGYVGSLGRHLASWYEGDPITAAGHAACLAGSVPAGYPSNYNCNSGLAGAIHQYFPQFTADAAALVPSNPAGLPNGTPWYTSIATQTTENASSYNSLQVSLVKSRSHGFSGTFAYTYSHALDNGSGYESSTGSESQGAGHVQISTPGFTYLNYGDSDYDARHRFVASYVYEVPVFAAIRSNALLRETLAGWEVGGVTVLQTGFPIGIAEGADRSLWCDGYSYFGCGDTPVTSSFHIKHEDIRKVQTLSDGEGNPITGHFYFDPSTFTDEPVGTYGNVKRNSLLHGPGYNYTDLQLSKNFHFSAAHTDRYVQLRIEAANAFNHANFAAPGGNFAGSKSTFGVVTTVQATADPNQDPTPARVFQLVGKVYF
ncbi:carboxypeptidase-like regulatory domain-containing protein [Granulicella sp. S156]|uniref:TonB-dependent receptor n=1 Tax=Granulicella sp. S156 TaxID=1747224 RepID=UPI00131C695A|nr:carboxypeptidase-like regulatory domain-containing protein [Granulicella sp. S156]